jgi:probable HAF family extracellular repeat protein
MKHPWLSILFALTTSLSLGQFANAQDSSQPATKYVYTAINFPGATYTQAFAINDSGEVVGTYGTATQFQNGFSELKGKYTTIECVPYSGTLLADINNKGEIVGSYATNDGGAITGMMWEGEDSCFPISPNGLGTTSVWGVNDSGSIVGWYTNSAGTNDAFLYVNSNYTIIDCPNAVDTRAYGIADNGDVVGDLIAATGQPFQGMIYKSGKCTTVNFPGAASTSAKSMNKKGQIAGWYTDTKGVFHGFVKTGKTYQTLNYPGATNTLAFHLNDQGRVAGWYQDTAGVDHGFVATPKTGAGMTFESLPSGSDSPAKHVTPYVILFPTSGYPGATVNMTSAWSLIGATSVTFNRAPASFQVVSSSLITATVPANATSGRVDVRAPSGYEGILGSTVSFTVE